MITQTIWYITCLYVCTPWIIEELHYELSIHDYSNYMVDIMPVCMYIMNYKVATLWTKYTWLLKLYGRYHACLYVHHAL